MTFPCDERAAIQRAANAMCGWLYDNLDVETCERLDELHPIVWCEAAEVAMRAGRWESDPRPFTTSFERLG